MLILTRSIGEVIRIGDDIEIVITGINYGQVKVGVNAPKSIEVHREEVYERIQKNRKQKKVSDHA